MSPAGLKAPLGLEVSFYIIFQIREEVQLLKNRFQGKHLFVTYSKAFLLYKAYIVCRRFLMTAKIEKKYPKKLHQIFLKFEINVVCFKKGKKDQKIYITFLVTFFYF